MSVDKSDAPLRPGFTLNEKRRTLNLVTMTNDFATGVAFMTNDWRPIARRSFVIGHRASDAVICHAQTKALTDSMRHLTQVPRSTKNAQR